MDYHLLLKYMLVGDSGTGKSSIFTNYTQNRFNEEHHPTINVEFDAKYLTIDEKIIKASIWDVGGQSNFQCILKSYFRGSNCFLLIFDLTNKNTFQNVQAWLKEIQNFKNEIAEICLVGNKFDLEELRQVSKQEAEEFAQEHNLPYFEISAKTLQNIDNVFVELARKIILVVDKQSSEGIHNIEGIKIGSLYQNHLQLEKPKKNCF